MVRLGQRGGRPSSQAKRRHPVPITPRQGEVLSLVLDGLRNREIAERLGISIRTVEVHRLSGMKRLGVHGVADLFREVFRLGLARRLKGPRRLRLRRPALQA